MRKILFHPSCPPDQTPRFPPDPVFSTRPRVFHTPRILIKWLVGSPGVALTDEAPSRSRETYLNRPTSYRVTLLILTSIFKCGLVFWPISLTTINGFYHLEYITLVKHFNKHLRSLKAIDSKHLCLLFVIHLLGLQSNELKQSPLTDQLPLILLLVLTAIVDEVLR